MLTLWKPFEEFFGPTMWDWMFPTLPERRAVFPFTGLEEKEGEYLMKAELPGYAPEEVKVELKGNVIEIYGKHEGEGRYGEFRRLFTLPKNVKLDAIAANMANGLLTVVLPKVEVTAAEPKAIPIAVEPKAIPEAAKPEAEKKVA